MNDRDDEEIKIADDFRRQLQERFPAYGGDRAKEDVLNWVKGNPKLEEFISTLGANARKELLDEMHVELEATPLPNPRDEPFTHRIVQELCNTVESACRRAGVPLRGGVAYGVSPTFAPNAEQHPVPTTGTSVVELSAGLISFCSHLSKAPSWSIPHQSVENSLKLDHQPAEVLRRIGSDTELKRLWLELFGAYAYGEGPLDIEMRIIPYPYSLTRALLLRAFELFAVPHECASCGRAWSHGEPGESGVIRVVSQRSKRICLPSRCAGISNRKRSSQISSLYPERFRVLLKCLDYVRRTRKIFAGRYSSEEVKHAS